MCVRLVAVPNMPRVGGTAVSFTVRAANSRSVSSRFSLQLAARDHGPVDRRRRGLAEAVRCAQGSNSRSDPRSSRGCPGTARACGRPHAQEVEVADDQHALRWRDAPPERPHSGAKGRPRRPNTVAQTSTQSSELRSIAGNGVSSSVDEKRRCSASETTSHGSSSTVRWRSVRWSRSYRPASLGGDDPNRHGEDEKGGGRGRRAAGPPVADDDRRKPPAIARKASARCEPCAGEAVRGGEASRPAICRSRQRFRLGRRCVLRR